MIPPLTRTDRTDLAAAADAEANPFAGSAASLGGDPRVIAALEDYLSEARAGARPDRAEFLARHAEIASALGECLGGLDFIQDAAASDGSGTGPEVEGPVAPASTLGDFRIVRELGRGGMGIVYEAEQVSLGRRVALKVLPFAAAIDPRRIRRFQVEAQAAAQLHHPHIVAIFAVGCDRGVHYYAMQLIEGRTLAAVIEEMSHAGGLALDGPDDALALPGDAPAPDAATTAHDLDVPVDGDLTPPPSTVPASGSTPPRASAGRFLAVARLGIQAAEALEHAHGLGVLHRDVKPANLMIDADGGLWITDFGLARFQEDVGLTRSGDVLGTLRYMSPEQARAGGAIVDQRTDIYSLGATLYELATLRPAFDGRDRPELLRRVMLDDPTAPRRLDPTIPRDLETIILKAMAKDPASRYAAARELADDLRRFLEHKPIRARRPTMAEHLAKWARRHRAAVAAASVALLLAMAIASALLWGEQRKTARALADLETILERERSTLPRVLMDTWALSMFAMQTFAAEHHDPNATSYVQFYNNTLNYYEGLIHLTSGDTDARMREVNAKALYGRGLARMILQMPGAEDDYRASIAAFDVLLRESPDRPDLVSSQALTLFFLAESLNRAGRLDDAEAPARRSISIMRDLVRRHPQEPQYRQEYAGSITRLAEMLAIAGRRPRAAQVFDEAIENDPSNAEALNALAWLLATRPDATPYDPARALGLAERAVKLRPDVASFWNTLGVARLRNNRPDAIEGFDRSIKAGSSNKPPFDWFPLAIVHAKRGESTKAREFYDQAVEWTRQNPSKDSDLIQVQIGGPRAARPAQRATEAPARAKTPAPAHTGPA